MRFAIFPLHLSTKNWCQVIRSAAPVTQDHLSPNWRWCSKMQPLSGNQRPDLLTSLMNMSLVLRLPRVLQNPRVLLKLQNPLHLPRKIASEPSKSGPRMVCFVHFDFEICFAPQRRALFQHLNFQKCSERGVFCTFWLRNVLRATTVCTFSTSQLPKVVREWCVLYILTWKCASRHNGVHFFNISTSKSALNVVFFVHFEIEMCFAPQRCALFRHLNFQKWFEAEVFYTLWLENVRRATTACNFSCLIWPDGSASAALASLLFDPSGPQIIGKTQCFATFLPFRAPGSSFFGDFLFSDILSSSLLFSSLLWLFPSLLFICPYCRKFDF